jgi:hypothetical protein
MSSRRIVRSLIRLTAAAARAAAGVYGAYAAVTWLRYGHPAAPTDDERDALLDRFLPAYDVVERHAVRVNATADVTLDAAGTADLFDAPLVRAIFKGRELLLGAAPDERRRGHGLLAQMQSLGWVVLADVPGRELVVGAVTRPWESNVTFRGVPPADFATFAEPGYVKIAWTLRADPDGHGGSIFRTETRAAATDESARVRFRRYWSFLSPGIILIRRVSLRTIKAAAERAYVQSATL